MGMGREFREFVAKGNVIDLAVGVVVGAAFGKIVSSLVADVITPPLGLALGGVDFKALKLQIGGTPEAPVTINYGLFVQALFDYVIIALIIFLIIKAINAMRRREEAAPTVPTTEEVLLAEIRDLLKESRSGAGPGV